MLKFKLYSLVFMYIYIQAVKRTILTTQNLTEKIVAYDEVDRLMTLAGLSLVKQEVITVCREIDPKKTGFVKLTQLLKFVMEIK